MAPFIGLPVFHSESQRAYMDLLVLGGESMDLSVHIHQGEAATKELWP